MTKYKPSHWTQKDYRKLAQHLMQNGCDAWTMCLRLCKYRDKRIQRTLYRDDCTEVIFCDYENVPLYISHRNEATRIVAAWRLSVGK